MLLESYLFSFFQVKLGNCLYFPRPITSDVPHVSLLKLLSVLVQVSNFEDNSKITSLIEIDWAIEVLFIPANTFVLQSDIDNVMCNVMFF